MGWIRGLFGPAFIDLQMISGVTLTLGSWITTLTFIGYALGCASGGFLYDKLNRNFLYGSGLLVVGIATAAIPWCFLFVLMVVAHFCQGFASGVADTVGNTQMMSMWREKKMMFFFVEFSYSIGVFVAPIIVAPFLSDDDNIKYHGHEKTSHNVSFSSNSYDMSSISTVPNDVRYEVTGRLLNTSWNNSTSGNLTNFSDNVSMVTRLFVPYSISAILAVLVSVPFYIKYFMRNLDTEDDTTQVEGEVNGTDKTQEVRPRVLPPKLKAFTLILICIVIFLGLSIGESFVSFIVVYCVDEAGFSPADGALVSAVSNIACILATIVAVFASRLNTLVYLGIHIVGTLVGFLALLVSSITEVSLGIWISSGVVGYFRAMIFSLVFTWTNNYITPTTGKISSLFMICTCTGAAVTPLLLGWLMEEYDNLWFCYLLIILIVFALVLYIVGMVLTKYITTVYGKTFDHAVIEDISLTEKLNKEVDSTDAH
ncbi:sodium-dependent glucose transporter 1B-like isoform X3 [Ylistrum balloti]|uniref:sodium-dependent glucose transporter 1B-like isoform X3 n=1 Tax=Ylistrum balloti TaxID=509963 RepID=UPI002905EF2D|nr:sodium-dependent glucose transporter 1B-like isoform X3 [Ylistrum balloti]